MLRAAFSLSDTSRAGGFCMNCMTAGPGIASCFPRCPPNPGIHWHPRVAVGFHPLPVQGELAARPGLKFPVNFPALINLGAVSKVKEDHNTIHGELHNLGDESKGNGMKFKTTKCKVMHLGINKKFCSKLGAHQLETREEQRDVSVLVNQRMAASLQGVARWKSRSLSIPVQTSGTAGLSWAGFHLGSSLHGKGCPVHREDRAGEQRGVKEGS